MQTTFSMCFTQLATENRAVGVPLKSRVRGSHWSTSQMYPVKNCLGFFQVPGFHDTDGFPIAQGFLYFA